MKTYTETVTRRVGENMGDIPGDYPWIDESVYPNNPETRVEKGNTILEIQRLFKEGKTIEIYEDSMIHHRLLEVGMYDGWPYWRPYPHVCVRAALGGCEWHPWYSIQGFEVVS